MIDPTELRIGNIVEAENCGYRSPEDCYWTEHRITRKDLSDSDTAEFKEVFRPIPLTEEWLVRMGFVVEKSQPYEKQFSPPLPHSPCWIHWTEHSGFFFEFENYQLRYDDVTIKHVHQLQNLYHALTGNELEVKPTQKA